ncbi:MAG: phospholipid/glycerol acyltransferase [Actinomycetia bacterium]|nr:phospholipid/glycerol acyltransferase [Actinomycetes bacterium]
MTRVPVFKDPGPPDEPDDVDTIGSGASLASAVKNRVDGLYPIDPFGGDPQIQDLLAPLVQLGVRAHVTHPELLPASGPAVLVSNRGLGVVEPVVLAVAVREAVGRRLRVLGAPEIPLLGDAARRLGGIGYHHEDLAAVLRAGHLVAVPLGNTWLRTGAGEPPVSLIVAALGFPVIPVLVRPAGPFGVPWLGRWNVTVGPAVVPDAEVALDDPLSAAELAELARAGVQALIDAPAPTA